MNVSYEATMAKHLRRRTFLIALALITLPTTAHSKGDKGDKGGDGGKGKGGDKGGGKDKPGSKGSAGRKAPRSDIELVYKSGIREIISGGVYVMRDAQGRQIVRRRATRSDMLRMTQRRQR